MSALQRIAISTQQRQGDALTLTMEQRHYLRKVLRLRTGDRFIALDETDYSWVMALTEGGAAVIAPHCSPDQATTELTCRVTLQVAMPKTGMEDIIRQTTELGVYRLQPVISDRVILKPGASKQQRWQRVAQEAAEQCERQHWPRLGKACPLSAVFAAPPDPSAAVSPERVPPRRYICAARRDAPSLLGALNPSAKTDIWVATGPEGGWTDKEITAAIAAGYQPVRLGNRILRAVTAPVMVMALLAATYDQSKI